MAVSDEIIITTSVDRDQVIKHLDSNADSIKYSITKPLDPSPGKLSLTSLYSQRTDSIGLWVFQIERIGEITPQ